VVASTPGARSVFSGEMDKWGTVIRKRHQHPRVLSLVADALRFESPGERSESTGDEPEGPRDDSTNSLNDVQYKGNTWTKTIGQRRTRTAIILMVASMATRLELRVLSRRYREAYRDWCLH